MPNRGQTQDQGKRGRSDPGNLPPDDDETARNQDNQRQLQEQQARQNPRDLPEEEGADIESNDEADDDDDEVTGVSQ